METKKQASMRMTFDHNCIVALEEVRDDAPYLRRLVAMNGAGELRLQVVGVGASEMQMGGTYAQNFEEFQRKLSAVGLTNVDILQPMGYWDISYWDWCVWTDDTMEELERKIHAILFPAIAFEYAACAATQTPDPSVAGESKLWQKWRNAKCDVQSLWCHIWYSGDIFVTTDHNFHKATKKPRLIALGAGNILQPQETLQFLAAM